MKKTCYNCGRVIAQKEYPYIMKIEIFAEAGPLEISEEELSEDLHREMEELVELMKEMDPEELSDQVYEAYCFRLCPQCRETIHQKLKAPPFSSD